MEEYIEEKVFVLIYTEYNECEVLYTTLANAFALVETVAGKVMICLGSKRYYFCNGHPDLTVL